MSAYIDKSFINRVGLTLRNFSWKKETLANCSCPICGDSDKNKSKARGYFFEKGNQYLYKCHNCGHACNLNTFLKQVNPSLLKEYRLESWKDNQTHERKEEPMLKTLLFDKPKISEYLKDCTRVDLLESDHPCKQFVIHRNIPKSDWKRLYYTKDFGSFMKRMNPATKACGEEERLVIPFYNKNGDVVAAQGRVLNFTGESKARHTVKYITVKSDAIDPSERLWYNQWNVNPKKKIYIVEGPIDSMFLKNAIAMVGAGAIDNIPNHLKKSVGVYVLDNEPRNKQICDYMQKLIDLGKNICIWPTTVFEKDINDMIYTRTSKEIQWIIDKNTFSGLEAKLRLQNWRKV